MDTGPDDQESVPISALEHFAYCSRQAALIHVDRYFDSNLDTVRGDLAHAAVDQLGPGNDRHGRSVWRSLPVWSDTLRLHGVCDVVEFGPDGPVPIEHKSGAYRPGSPADLQVAAQVLCLREMFSAVVPNGVVFSGRDRRRHQVPVDAALADEVVRVAEQFRALFTQARLPAPRNDSRCRRCSLQPGCVPHADSGPVDLFTARPAGEWRD